MTLKEIRELFRQQIVRLTGLDGKHVRFFYSEDSAPKFSKGENVIYYSLVPVESAVSQCVDAKYEAVDDDKAKQVLTYNRVLQLNITAYGDLAAEYTRLLRMEFLNKSRNKLLRESHIHPVTEIAEPSLVWENYNNNWIERSDLTIQYNALTTNDEIATKEPIYYVTGSSITIKTDQGHDRDIDFEK